MRRAFSLLELAVAITVLAAIAGVVTVAIAQSQMTASQLRLERQVRSVLTSMVDQVSTAPYASLVQGSFTRPDACSDDATRSCLEIWGHPYEVAWSKQVATDLSTVVLSAVATTVNRPDVTVSRTVAAPGPDWAEGSATVRARVSGDGYTGLLYVVSASGAVLGDAAVTDGSAVILIDAITCTTSSPCRLALNPSGSAMHDGWSLDAVSVVGNAGKVVANGGVADVSAIVTTGDRLVVRLSSQNPDGRQGAPTRTGSVCLWASFDDGVAQRWLPGCNSALADRIVFDEYLPDSARPQLRLALPRGARLSLATARTDETCPVITGHVVAYDGAWVTNRSECASWTFGTATSVLSGSSTTPIASYLWTVSAASEVTALWSGAAGRPAAGFEGEPLWSKPRDARSCSVNDSCTEPASSVLEPDSCPTAHCLSSMASRPVLTLPARGGAKLHSVVGDAGDLNDFSLGVLSPDSANDDETTVTILTAPGLGSVSIGEVVLDDGDTVGTYFGPTGLFALTWDAPTGSPSTAMTLRLTSPAGTSDVEVILTTVTGPALVRADALSAAQGAVTSTTVVVYGSNGAPLSGATVTGTGPAGTVVGSGVTATDGSVTIPVTVQTTVAGRRTLTFTATKTVSGDERSMSGSTTLVVTPTPTTLTVTAGDVGRNGTATVQATVVDAAGVAIAGQVVEFSVTTTTGDAVRWIRTRPGGCITDANGTCSSLLVADADVSEGSYRLRARAGQAQAIGTFSVAAQARNVTTTRTRITQGSTAPMTVTVTDGDGNALSGETVLVTTPPGLTASVNGTTNASGRATVTFTASSELTTGTRSVTLIIGSLERNVSVQVAPKVTSAVSLAPLQLVPGGSVAVALQVLDAADDPATTVAVRLSSDGLIAPSSTTTGVDGVARFNLLAPQSASPRPYLLQVYFGTTVVGEIPVTVARGVATVLVANTLQAGNSNQDLVLELIDDAGSNVSGKTVTVTSRTTGVRILTATGTSNSPYGRVTIPVSVRADAPRAFGLIDVSVDGRIFTVSVKVTS